MIIERPRRKRSARYECQYPHCEHRSYSWTCNFEDTYGKNPEPHDRCPCDDIHSWLYDFVNHCWVVPSEDRPPEVIRDSGPGDVEAAKALIQEHSRS